MKLPFRFESWPRAAVAALALVAACNPFEPGYDFATVEVRATDEAGTPVAGVNLLLFTGTRQFARGTTGSAGEHVFTDVAEGQYGVAGTPPAPYEVGVPGSTVVDTLRVRRGSVHRVTLTFVDSR